MDSLTHALIGATVAQLGPRQRIGREASWVMAGSAMLPDLDTLAAPLMSLTGAEVDDLARISIHRGLSHSLLAVPVFALPVALLWWWARRRRDNSGSTGLDKSSPGAARPFVLLYGSVLLAAACHPLLDWCTSYGTQLLAPVSNARFSLDAIPIIDIFFTPLLIITLLVCYIIRKARPGHSTAATLAVGWAGFALAVGYIAAGRVLHDVAVRRAATAAGKAHVLSANAYPVLGSIFLWRGVVRTEDGWSLSRQNLLHGGAVRPHFAPQDDNEWVTRAEALEQAATFRWFAQGQIRTAYARRDGLHIVELHDMRYGVQPDSAETLWALRVVFHEDDLSRPQVQRVTNYRGMSFRRLFRQAWDDLWRR